MHRAHVLEIVAGGSAFSALRLTAQAREVKASWTGTRTSKMRPGDVLTAHERESALDSLAVDFRTRKLAAPSAVVAPDR
jgi:hypothetical protein